MNSPSIRRPRAHRRWTYADYCRIPADGRRHEILDGRHFVNPAPSPYHQLVSIRLAHQLMSRIADRGLGTVLASPIDVHLGPASLVQPDLVAIRHKNRSIVGAVKVSGVPDLMIEILSPSTRWHDGHRKRERYERAGVREFWIVDPALGCIEQFVLRKKRFVDPVVVTSSIALRVFRGVVLDLTEVW